MIDWLCKKKKSGREIKIRMGSLAFKNIMVIIMVIFISAEEVMPCINNLHPSEGLCAEQQDNYLLSMVSILKGTFGLDQTLPPQAFCIC
ncbi:hypothetical protein FCM35_KLT10387 [Carex littledalei]|uniref:Uncharacterized protein n=1 Tax=Carex littledalei TaxID=544730 RepID=A0A833V4U7_9POAL|nr:hypothetical protein FCM35_KLT10387 [Carex littledalei]